MILPPDNRFSVDCSIAAPQPSVHCGHCGLRPLAKASTTVTAADEIDRLDSGNGP